MEARGNNGELARCEKPDLAYPKPGADPGMAGLALWPTPEARASGLWRRVSLARSGAVDCNWPNAVAGAGAVGAIGCCVAVLAGGLIVVVD